MSNQKVSIQIVDLLEQPDYKGTYKKGPKTGQDYIVKQWTCSARVNGGELQKGVNLKAMGSDTEAVEAVKEGATLDCWPDEYNGQLKGYKYSTPKQRSGGGYTGGRERVKYTREEYEALFMHAVMFVKTKVLPSVNTEDPDIMSRLVSTYLIGAKDSGIKVGPADANA